MGVPALKVLGNLSIVTYIEIMYVPFICIDVLVGHLGALVGAKVDPLLLLDVGAIFDVHLHGHKSADVNSHLLERLVGGGNCVDQSSLLEALPDLKFSYQDAVCIMSECLGGKSHKSYGCLKVLRNAFNCTDK